MYKKILKKSIISLSLLLILLLFVCWVSFKVNPLDIFRYLGAQAGTAVGMSTGVPENPFSSIAKQLKEEENRLQEKEENLNELEGILEKQYFTGLSNNILLNLILGIVIILFILILFNFYLDYKNRKRERLKEENH